MHTGILHLGVWVHDLNPVAVRFTESFGIRWYGLAYVAGFIAAWWLLVALAKRQLIQIKPQAVADVILALVVGVMVGGRLGYVLVYRPALLTEFSSHPPFWGVFDIMSGGMASHGGILGVIIAGWFIARANKITFRHSLDCIAAVAPIGIFFGRLANFVNGELLGSIVANPGQPAPWWSVKYPQELLERFHESGRTPDQSAQLEVLLQRFATPEDGSPGGAIDRVIHAIQHGNAALKAELAPLLSARHPSQFYQAAAEGLLVFAVIWFVWRKPRMPGVITALFLIVYGVGRVATEFIRLPDAHFGAAARIDGLSRGQWLSVVMVIAGTITLILCSRAKAERIGGWAARPATKTTDHPVG